MRMKYLDMVVNESLRFMNIAPFIVRTLDDDEEIGEVMKLNNLEIFNALSVADGFKFPKGAVVILFFHGCHNDEEYFPNPDKFDPERFSKENTSSNIGAFLPFGMGVRNCIGKLLIRLGKYLILFILF